MLLEDQHSCLIRDQEKHRAHLFEQQTQLRLKELSILDLQRELDCRRDFEERRLRETKEAMERARHAADAGIRQREDGLRDHEQRLEKMESELREKEKLITQLMLAGAKEGDSN
jgi:hypothetical protein